MLVVMTASVSGVMLIGIKTYQGAPPIPAFADESGRVLADAETVLRGQAVFQKYALMEYGTMFGDGAGRGPDYTADALHFAAVYAAEFYAAGGDPDAARARVQREIKENRYRPATNTVTLTAGLAHAYQKLIDHYAARFDGSDPEGFKPAGYITDRGEIADLTAFFYWGAWVCGVERPGYAYSYTHNWPYDPLAGNLPTSGVMLWSVLGALGFILVLGVVLYLYGKVDDGALKQMNKDAAPVATAADADHYKPTPTQRASYRFFTMAAVLFFVQILAGILTIHDFVGFTTFFGVDIAKLLPITVVRSWHVQLSVVWISACWMGATVFILPLICRPEPAGQLRLVNALFWTLNAVVAGTAVGLFLGPKGYLGDWWVWVGHQGWEFIELGKLWQWVLYGAFGLWAVIIIRGVWPTLRARDPWSMPHWLVYTVGAIVLLFASGFVATPRTNFVIADFWRWCVIHMWVEAFFEVFTTVLVGYFMYVMGLVSAAVAVRVVYLGTILFLGSGILGISHNFYWNAKSIETVALGSIFSTLQVVPLILLTLEAWRFRNGPQEALRHGHGDGRSANPAFGLTEPFLFLLAVNFWNFLGAGVFGFIINLPIMNYYEHGTYLTVNHGHAALMGVYGNLAIAAVLFCGRYLIAPSRWNASVLRLSFWALNLGLMLMVLLDLFPAGVMQLVAVLDHGLWYARSQQFILGEAFQTVTWMRVIGGAMFVVGGVVPLAWFILSRARDLKPASDAAQPFVAEARRLASTNGVASAGAIDVPAEVQCACEAAAGQARIG